MIKVKDIKAPPKKGRPRIEDKGKSFEATKPWVALGMSRRTWYARRKEKRDQVRIGVDTVQK
jgi:hypothetical protein